MPERARAIVGPLVAVALLAAAAVAEGHGTGAGAWLAAAQRSGSNAAGAPPAAAAGCRSSVDPEQFASAERMLEWNEAMADFGPRPTGSPNHERFVDSLERRFAAMPGMEVESIGYEIDRQLETHASLAAGGSGEPLQPVPVSGPVPYAKLTSAEGRLLYVPSGESLSDHDLEGRIVVRDAGTGSIPYAAFSVVEWWRYDPDLSFTAKVAGNYERDWLANEARIAELEQAAEGGAAGFVFVHGFPREQVLGQYTPYHGIFFGLPAVYVGADEGERLKQLARDGGRARVQLAGSRVTAPTRTLVATLPGVSDERIVVESHTDGMNAVWDNGPIGMLALAQHFAALPRECRPRTIQFVFATAHLYQALGATRDIAAELDRDYERGEVALVVVLEHLGAREYEARERPDGPGRVLAPTGRSEPNTFFVGESPVLVEEMLDSVVSHDLGRSIALRGADAPGVRLPPHQNFGGEGSFFQRRLLPTVALITGPWTLFNPAFGMEALDGELLRKQSLVFADFIHAIDELPREALAGGYLAERGARSALCNLSEDGLGLTDCGDT